MLNMGIQTWQEMKTWQKNLVVFLFVVGILSRLWVLGDRAYHHDESIHAYYSYEIATEGRFKGADNNQVTFGYNPVYHGPFLYHFGGLFFFLFGDSDFTGRLPFAAVGIFLLWIIWQARYLTGVPIAMGMLGATALSPIVNYYSRFARNDVYIGTFFLAAAIFAGLYLVGKKSYYLVLAVFMLAVGYSVKENSYMYGFGIGVFAIAWGVVRLFFRGRKELDIWFGRAYPVLVLLTIYACLSTFVFTYVAVDYRIDPTEHGFFSGVVFLARHASGNIEEETTGPQLRAKIQQQTRFFSAPSRSTAKRVYFVMAFAFTFLLLLVLEGLRWVVRRKQRTYASSTGIDPPEVGISTRTLRVSLVLALVSLVLSVCFLWQLGLKTFLISVIFYLVFELLRSNYLSAEDSETMQSGLFRWISPWLLVLSACMSAVLTYCLLFSQMFADPPGLTKGLYDYVEYWFGHQLGEWRIWGPWWFYLARLIVYEYAFLLVSVGGVLLTVMWMVVICFRRSEQRKTHPFGPFMWFVMWMAVFNIFIYAVLHEKAPWLAFHQALPLAMLAGALVGWGINQWQNRWFKLFLVLTVLPLGLLTVKTHLQVNHIWGDNTAELVSQQQADRDLKSLIELVYRLSKETGQFEDFVVASEDKVEWPLPWYFRRFNNYRVKTADANAMVQFGDDSSFMEMRAKFGDKYVYRKYLHRGAWIENQMGKNELPGGQSLWENIKAYWRNTKFKEKPFRWHFWNYFFHRERWSNINPKYGYAYIRKEILPTLEPLVAPDGSFAAPTMLRPEQEISRFGSNNSDSLRVPRGLAIDSSGHVHVTDSLNGRIVVFDAEGQAIRTYASPDVLKVDGGWGPNGLAVDASGYAYIADTWNHRVVKFGPDGAYLTSWGTPTGSDGTKFFGPRGIAIGPDGNVYVADTGDAQIEVFTSEGARVRDFGSRGIARGSFDEPVGMCFNQQGHLVVADTGNDRIQFLTTNGGSLDVWLVPGWTTDKVGMEPFMGYLPDGRLVLTMAKKNQIRVFDADGQSVKNYRLPRNDAEPSGLVVAPDGAVWLSDRKHNVVYRVRIP